MRIAISLVLASSFAACIPGRQVADDQPDPVVPEREPGPTDTSGVSPPAPCGIGTSPVTSCPDAGVDAAAQ